MTFLSRLSSRIFGRFGSGTQPYYSLFAYSTSSDMPAEHVISFDDLKVKLADKSVILIDVREPQELKDDGKIPGSFNIPLGSVEEAFKLSPDTFQERYGLKMPKPSDPNVVFSCKAGRRAASAAQKLAPLGFTNTKIYSGSFNDWVERGGPLEK